MKELLFQYLLLLGDNTMILGHRLSELCGHGPSLETDIALTNISLDLFGQTRHYFKYAAKIKGKLTTEDDIAFLRYPNEYKNVVLVEQPNHDFAYVIGRQFLFDTFHLLYLEQLRQSKDKQLSAIAEKSIKEVKYHFRFSSEWIKRLGDGTEESHEKIQGALDHLWPYTGGLFEETPIEKEMKMLSIAPELSILKEQYLLKAGQLFKEAKLKIPEMAGYQSGGKKGIHSEHLGYILSDLQYMQRAYPGMNW